MFRPWSATKRVHVRIPGSRWLGLLGSALILGLAVALVPLNASAIATDPGLGTAKSFGVLAGQTVTNTGPTRISGDLGLHPGTSVTGAPAVVNGTSHITDAVALKAKDDLTTAYNNAAGEPCSPTNTLTGKDLGGLTLTPDVYCFKSSAGLTGTLTLDGKNDPNAVFVFQIGSTLITAPNSTVSVINGNPCNIYWQVGSSATLDTTTKFVGTIMALTSIALNTGAQIVPGRALARNGAVTLDTNVITRPDICAPGSSTTTTLTTSPKPAVARSPVRLAASVTSGGASKPTGAVTYTEGSTTLSSAPLDSSGNATFTTSDLGPGTHAIMAVYPGAAGSSKAPGFLPSASQVVVQDVTPAPAPAPSPSPGSPGLPSTGHPPGP